MVFATDVAETGVTIDGVRHIVDSGLCKESTYDPKRNVTVLSVQTICRSSAEQRKGRAGRTAPGTCYRLYSSDDFDGMSVSHTPEVLSRPLQLTVVSMIAMGIDPLTFEWMEAPDKTDLEAAIRDLVFLGALTTTQGPQASPGSLNYCLTGVGELIAELQIDPGMARMVHASCQQGLGEVGCTIAAVMSVASSFFWRGSSESDKKSADKKHLELATPHGDVVSMYLAYTQWENMLNSYKVQPPQLEGKQAKHREDDDQHLEHDDDQGIIDLATAILLNQEGMYTEDVKDDDDVSLCTSARGVEGLVDDIDDLEV